MLNLARCSMKYAATSSEGSATVFELVAFITDVMYRHIGSPPGSTA